MVHTIATAEEIASVDRDDAFRQFFSVTFPVLADYCAAMVGDRVAGVKPPAGWPPGPAALAPPDAVLAMAQPWHQGSDRVSVATTPPLARSQGISSPSLVVTPARRLLDRQRVLVQLSGFPAYTGVGVSECANTAAVNPKGCSVPLDSYLHLATDAAGNATGTLLVTRKAHGRLGLPPAVLCTTRCMLMASMGPNVHPMTTWAPLEFLAGRPHGTGQGGGR